MRFVEWYEKNQKRMAAIVAAVGIAVVALSLLNRWPRESSFRFELDADIAELDVRYLIDGELVQAARFQDAPLPLKIDHALDLAPGDYVIELDLLSLDKSRHEIRHRVTLPQEGIIVVSGLAQR